MKIEAGKFYRISGPGESERYLYIIEVTEDHALVTTTDRKDPTDGTLIYSMDVPSCIRYIDGAEPEDPDPEEKTIIKLESMEKEVFKAHKVTARPTGKKWAAVVLDMARRIYAEMDPDEITKEDLNTLYRRYHTTATAAAEVAKTIKKYE